MPTAILGDYHARRVEHDLTQDERRIVDEFHKLYYRRLHFRPPDQQPSDRDTWLGHRVLKCPMDLMTYQEILFDTRPDVIVETGTFYGGSAFFLATMCELIGRGRVITIDTRPIPGNPMPKHALIEYLYGPSQSPEILAAVKSRIARHERSMVILDSDHRKNHVAAELRSFSPLVSTGCYLIVEDGNFNGHPIHPNFGPGPMEAINEFISTTDQFVIDRSREKQLLTFNPSGYLLRL